MSLPAYNNPIIPGFHPDPSICRVGSDYYLVTSSFEFFPGVPLFHSTNLVDWEQIGHVLTRSGQVPLEGCPASGGIYAPTIRHHDGRFYMVTTNMHGPGKPYGHFYVWTDDIRGEWSDPVRVDMPGFDPDLFFDDSGEVWFTCTNGMSRIDLATGKLVGEPVTRWPGIGGTWSPEGPHIYKIQGWYYTLLAEGGTDRGHMVTIARSRQPGGPYEACPHNPLLTHAGRRSLLQSTGHGDLVQAVDGRWWMVFLAIRLSGNRGHLLGRETCLAPVEWDADGWPVVNGGKTVPLEVVDSGLPRQKAGWKEWSDDFVTPRLKVEWTFLRNPDPENWSLTDPPGALSLRCAGVSLDEDASAAWVGRRLQHYRADLRVILDFDPQSDSEEAGLTLYLQTRTHYEVFVTRRGGRRVVMTRRRLGTLFVESDPVPLPDDGAPVVLTIRTAEDWMELGYERDGERVVLSRGEAGHLTTEVGGQFTGLFAGLYAMGPADGSSRARSARFRGFVYRVLDGKK